MNGALPRTWLLAHRAWPAFLAGLLLVTGCTILGGLRLPSLEPGRSFPLWLMFPGTLTTVVATTASDRLGWMARTAATGLRTSRLLWFAVVGLFSYGAGQLVGVSAGVPHLGQLTVSLALTGFSLATLHPAAGIGLGLAVDLATVVWLRGLIVIDPTQWVLDELGYPWLGAVGFLVCVLVVRYVLRGNPDTRSSWEPQVL